MIAAQCGRLGWVAFTHADRTLHCLTFGHPTRKAAVESLGRERTDTKPVDAWSRRLLERLQAYAAGDPVDFRDIAVELRGLTPFRRRVVEACRRIGYGRTLTYGQLAALAGSPGAARAVGNCMAANRAPLVVPCHRVVPADGRIGAFSAPGGPDMKKRLLRWERQAIG